MRDRQEVVYAWGNLTNDLQQLGPMLDATAATLTAAGVQDRPGTLLADCGYWTIANLTALPDAPGLIPPAKHAANASPARTASRQSPRATGSGRR
jgi:hypothetical protein